MSEPLRLVMPTMAYAKEIAAFKCEFQLAGDSMDGTGQLQELAEIKDWIKASEDALSKATCRKGWVPATQFICVRETDNKIVGMIQIRHYLNEYLANYGGHIGYSVRPSERRKGYATWMLKHSLVKCRELGLDKVMVSCVDSNEGSRRVISNNQGVYEATVYEAARKVYLEKYWITVP